GLPNRGPAHRGTNKADTTQIVCTKTATGPKSRKSIHRSKRLVKNESTASMTTSRCSRPTAARSPTSRRLELAGAISCDVGRVVVIRFNCALSVRGNQAGEDGPIQREKKTF